MSDSSLSYGAFGIGAVYQTAANQRTGCKKQKPPKPYRASKLRVSNSAMRSRAILEKPQKHVFLRDTRTLSSFLIIATLAPTTLLLHSWTSLLGSCWAQLPKNEEPTLATPFSVPTNVTLKGESFSEI